jgi:hypothetical protein
LLLPESLALVLLLLLPNLAAEPFAAAAAVVVDVVGAAHVGVVADAGNAKREVGAGAVVLFVVAVAVAVAVDDDDSKCVAAGDWGGCEPRKAREKSHERARKADEVQEDAASCPTETVGPHSLHTAPEIASSISLSLSLSPRRPSPTLLQDSSHDYHVLQLQIAIHIYLLHALIVYAPN